MTTTDMISTGFQHSCEDCETLLLYVVKYDFNKFSTKNRPYGGINYKRKGLLRDRGPKQPAYGEGVTA